MSNSDKYKISVIVPIYNVERYLKNNIESIINQNINMEVICVDDGSTDNSADIIKKYLQVDDRVKLFQKENGGVGSARNYGLKQATGKYVIFIDGDDYIEDNCLEVIFNTAEQEKLDIVQGCCKKVDEAGNYISGSLNEGIVNVGGCYSGHEWLIEKKLFVTVWLYLFRREYLIKNNLCFYEDIYHEDTEFTPRAIFFADKIKAIELCFYNYVQRDSSFMHTFNIQKSMDLIKIADRYKDFISSYIDKSQQPDIYNYFEKYMRYLYIRSLNTALLQGLSLSELLKDEELRNKLIFEIRQSNKKSHKIVTYLLKFKLYAVYTTLYKIKRQLSLMSK